MLAATAAIAGAATLGVVLSSGTYALWTDSTTIDAGILRAGDSRLVVSGTLAAAAFQDLLPGESVAQQIHVTNAGDVDLDVTGVVDAASAAFAVRLDLDAAACGTAPLADVAALGTSPTALGSLASGESVPLCVEVTVLPDALPRDAVDFAVTLEGVQS